MLEGEGCVAALGAVTGNQAMQMVLAGRELIYLSGWQVVADANTAGTGDIDWFVPIDADAGFGGALNAFEIIKAYIEAGAAGVHFED